MWSCKRIIAGAQLNDEHIDQLLSSAAWICAFTLEIFYLCYSCSMTNDVAEKIGQHLHNIQWQLQSIDCKMKVRYENTNSSLLPSRHFITDILDKYITPLFWIFKFKKFRQMQIQKRYVYKSLRLADFVLSKCLLCALFIVNDKRLYYSWHKFIVNFHNYLHEE